MGQKRRKRFCPFVMLAKDMLMSPAWEKLSHREMIVYVYLKKNFTGFNNGEIPMKYSELKAILSPATISGALKGLISQGWVERTKFGGMFRYYCLYKLTGKHDNAIHYTLNSKRRTRMAPAGPVV